MIDLALANLWKRRLRSSLCILGIVVSVALITTVNGLVDQLYDEMHRDVDRLEGKVFLQQKGTGYPPFSSVLNESICDEALNRTDINNMESTPLLLIAIEPGANPRETAEVFAVGIQPGKEDVYYKNAKSTDGTASLQGQDVNAVILGSKAQQFYNAEIGTTITVGHTQSHVVGILEEQRIALVDNGIYMSLAFCQQIFERPGQISALLITSPTRDQTEELATALETQYPSLESLTDKDINASLEKTLEMPDRFLGAIGLIVLLATCLMIMNVMIMAVSERTKEIGTLRAIGAKRRLVLKVIFYETAILTLIGGIFGILLAYALAQPALLNWTWSLSLEDMILNMGIICVVAVLSAAYPAYIAVKVDPLEALRYE